MQRTSEPTLKQYNDAVSKCKRRIQCPFCPLILPVNEWSRHACSRATSTSCPWCFGQFTFRSGQKKNCLRHLRNCFLAFKKNHATPRVSNRRTTVTTETTTVTRRTTVATETATASTSARTSPPPPPPPPHSPPPPPLASDCCPDCLRHLDDPPAPGQMLGRQRLADADPRLYRSVFDRVHDWLAPPPLDWARDDRKLCLVLTNGNVLDNPRSGLGEASDWIKRFHAFGETLGWYHVMVRAKAFPAFLAALEKHPDDVCLLPYWCLCDGKSDRRRREEPSHVHHRHSLLVTRMDATRFEKKIWRFVEASSSATTETGGGGKKLKFKTRVRSVHHLVNAICYVSSPKSKCKGAAGEELRDHDGTRRNPFAGKHHYHINNPVLPHAAHNLFRLYPSGQERFVTQTLGQRVAGLHSVARKEYDPVQKNRRFFVSPRDACPDLRRCPVAVSTDCQLAPPERDVSLASALGAEDRSRLPALFLFAGDDLLPLERNDALRSLDARAWVAHQVRRGNNAFAERVAHHRVALGRKQQHFLNEIERVVRDLKSDLRTRDRQLAEEREKLEEEREKVRRRDEQLEDLRRKYQTLRASRRAPEPNLFCSFSRK